jgi:hypothetical protein
MDRKIIGLSATHGVGKTTYAYELCTTLKKNGVSAVVLDERARECPFPINQIAVGESQAWIITSHIKKELELMHKYDIVVSDRSVIDAYIYGVVLNLEGCFNYLDKYCIEHIKHYYKKLYVLDPNYFNHCVDDGIRDMDPVFRMSVHKALIDIYVQEKVPFTLVKDSNFIENDIENILA